MSAHDGHVPEDELGFAFILCVELVGGPANGFSEGWTDVADPPPFVTIGSCDRCDGVHIYEAALEDLGREDVPVYELDTEHWQDVGREEEWARYRFLDPGREVERFLLRATLPSPAVAAAAAIAQHVASRSTFDL
jgi:hypothetical protein